MQNTEIFKLINANIEDLQNIYTLIIVDGEILCNNDLFFNKEMPINAIDENILQVTTNNKHDNLQINITVKDNVNCVQPLHIFFITTTYVNSSTQNSSTQNFNINLNIAIGANSSIKIFENNLVDENVINLAKTQHGFYSIPNIQTVISTKNAGKIFYIRELNLPNCMQKSQIHLNLAENSEATTLNLLRQIGKVDDIIYNNLQHQHINCQHYGMYNIQQSQECNININLQHSANSCTSKILFKGIATDHAIADFVGKIIVSEKTSNTQARLDNKNLLLMPTAKIKTLPSLEIYADDVQCSHGATIGQLDERALWYLQSRGINEAQAKIMLLDAFLQEIIQLK